MNSVQEDTSTEPGGTSDFRLKTSISDAQSGTSQAHLAPIISSDFPPLTEEDVDALRAANTSDDRIRKIAALRGTKRGAQKAAKKDLSAIIAEHKDWLLEQSGGRPLFSSKVVGMFLIQAEYHKSVRGYNAFGDKLGKHGLNLPSVVISGARRYDITYMGKSVEEKDLRQNYMDRADRDVLRELVAEFKEAAAGN